MINPSESANFDSADEAQVEDDAERAQNQFNHIIHWLFDPKTHFKFLGVMGSVFIASLLFSIPILGPSISVFYCASGLYSLYRQAHGIAQPNYQPKEKLALLMLTGIGAAFFLTSPPLLNCLLSFSSAVLGYIYTQEKVLNSIADANKRLIDSIEALVTSKSEWDENTLNHELDAIFEEGANPFVVMNYDEKGQLQLETTLSAHLDKNKSVLLLEYLKAKWTLNTSEITLKSTFKDGLNYLINDSALGTSLSALGRSLNAPNASRTFTAAIMNLFNECVTSFDVCLQFGLRYLKTCAPATTEIDAFPWDNIKVQVKQYAREIVDYTEESTTLLFQHTHQSENASTSHEAPLSSPPFDAKVNSPTSPRSPQQP